MHFESRNLGGPARLVAAALLSLLIFGFTGLTAPTQPAKSAKPAFDKNSPFYFDGTISRQTLENYLDRAITMGYFLVPGRPEGYQFPYRDDDVRMMFCWGWDEISWFAQQPEEYRNQWLHYAHNWIKQTDPNGHLQMPGTRMITCPNETLRTYFANTKSKTCPVGYSQEETIKRIWSGSGK